MSDRSLRLTIVVGLLALTAWRYASVRTAEYVYDDWMGAAHLQATSRTSVIGRVDQPLQLRELTRASYRLDRWIAGDGGPRIPHLMNLGWHLVNGVLVAVLISQLGLSPLGMGVVLYLFLLHPLQTEAVAYISERSELLAACGLLIGCIGILADDRSDFSDLLRWPLIIGGYLFAIAAKESAVMGIGVFYLLSCLRRQSFSWVWVVACGWLAIIVSEYTLWQVYRQIPSMPIGFGAFVQLQAISFWQGLIMVIVPLWQTVDHDPGVFRGWVQTLAVIGVISYGFVVGDLWIRRTEIGWQRATQIGLVGLLWPLILLAPRFVLRSGETLAEHHLYLPLLGWAMSLYVGGSALLSHLDRTSGSLAPDSDLDFDMDSNY